VVIQQQLPHNIWNQTYCEENLYLRVVGGHLRQELGENLIAPLFIVIETGLGYRLSEAL